MNRLSDRELDILHILWEADKPLIASEIIKKNTSLSISTVQNTLKSLIKKKYIKISEIVYSGKVLTRSYVPIITPNKYVFDEIQSVFPLIKKKSSFSNGILSALLNGEGDENVLIDDLEKIIEDYKKHSNLEED